MLSNFFLKKVRFWVITNIPREEEADGQVIAIISSRNPQDNASEKDAMHCITITRLGSG